MFPNPNVKHTSTKPLYVPLKMVEAFVQLLRHRYTQRTVLDRKPKKQKRKSSNLKKWVSKKDRNRSKMKLKKEECPSCRGLLSFKSTKKIYSFKHANSTY